jgi:hypothetical protein
MSFTKVKHTAELSALGSILESENVKHSVYLIINMSLSIDLENVENTHRVISGPMHRSICHKYGM